MTDRQIKRAIHQYKRDMQVKFIKTKLLAVAFILIAAIIPFVADGDCTASVIPGIMGIYLLSIKRKNIDSI